MGKKNEPLIPDESGISVQSHSLPKAKTGIASRFRRVHLFVAAGVLAVLAAGTVTWVALAGRPADADAAGPGSTTSNPTATSSAQVTSDPAAAKAGYPVPTWAAGNAQTRPSRNDKQPKGMPTSLSAKKDGDSVLLTWKDNTNNEDGFMVFVTQGWTSFQIMVPADTTQYRVAAAKNVSTCFVVVPFSWQNPVVSSSGAARECTARQHS